MEPCVGEHVIGLSPMLTEDHAYVVISDEPNVFLP